MTKEQIEHMIKWCNKYLEKYPDSKAIKELKLKFIQALNN